jgi:hypothetical protein
MKWFVALVADADEGQDERADHSSAGRQFSALLRVLIQNQ